METELDKNNVTTDVLRFRAFENVKKALYSIKLTTVTNELMEDDFVANFGRAWQEQRERI